MSGRFSRGGLAPSSPSDPRQGRQQSGRPSVSTSARRKPLGHRRRAAVGGTITSVLHSIKRPEGLCASSMCCAAGAEAQLARSTRSAGRSSTSQSSRGPHKPQQDRMGLRRNCRGTTLSFDPCCVRRTHPRHRSSRRLATGPADRRVMVECTPHAAPSCSSSPALSSHMFCSARSGCPRSATLITTWPVRSSESSFGGSIRLPCPLTKRTAKVEGALSPSPWHHPCPGSQEPAPGHKSSAVRVCGSCARSPRSMKRCVCVPAER